MFFKAECFTNVFLFETLHITSRRRICLTQAVILSSTSNSLSNFIANISALCSNLTSQVKITSNDNKTFT